MCQQSTVIREITNKTATPYGIFDIRALMSRGIMFDSDVLIVTEHSVKKYVQTLIINEPKESPYSNNVSQNCCKVLKWIRYSEFELKDCSLTKI